MAVSDVTQVVGAFGGLAGFSALGMQVWWRRNRRKVPSPELMSSLQWLLEAFEDIHAAEGQRAQWFFDRERQRQSRLLAVLNTHVVDNTLNELVGNARAHYNEAFASQSVTFQERQIAAVEAGRQKCVEAIERAGVLLRKYRD